VTVADNTSRNQYSATSGQTVFAYTFEIVDKDHIVVLKNGVALSEGTDYAVSNVGNDNGGNITLTSGATAGDIMTLYREMPYSRTQNYTNSGDFLASEVNSDFDELWLAGEQTDRAFSQSIRKPITDSDSISMELPEAATRANKFVKFDATGAVDVAGATVTVSAEDVSIDDAGNYYTSDNVEGALQEVGADLTANTTKLNTIETGADVTDTANVTAAGAVMDSELTNEAAVKALNQGVATTDSPTFAGLTVDAVTYTGTDGTDGQVLMTNGAGVAAFEDMPSSTYLDVTDFGATGDGTTDDTTSIQNAINHASNNEIQTIFFPAGHYKYTTLRLYHDATDNPNFQETPNRDGRFVFLGTGKLGLSDLKFLKTEPTRIYGSILESTSSGSGLIVEPTGTFSGTDARNFRGESMTFVADNTGYIVTSESCPGISFSNCSFKQFNTGGSGLKIRNAWFFTMDQCFIYGPSDTGEPAVNTGDGITGGTGYFAGLWNITNSLIDSFSNGVRWNEGTFVNVSVKNSAIQNCNNHGFYADGGTLQQLLFDNVYQENVGVRGRSFIKGDGSGSASAQIRNLRMTSSFMYGPYMTGPLVDLDSVDSINCEHLYVYRSRQTFLNVTDTKNNQISSGKLENCTFTTDEDVAKYYTNVNGSTTVFTGPYAQVASDLVVYVDDGSGANYTLTTDYTVSDLDNVDGATSTVTFNTAPVSGRSIKIIRPFNLLTGIMPSVDNVIYPTVDKGFYFTADPDGSTSRRQFIRLYDEANDLLPEYVDVKATTGIAKFGFGDTVVETITSSPYNIGGTAGRTYYDLTHTLAGGLAVYIPDTGEVNDGRLMIIKNNEATTSGYPYILVYNNSDQSTAIAQLSPGQAGLFIMDKQDGNKFKYTGRTFTNDLEMADNHKISFGRSEDLQIFHQSSDSTNRLVSGSANFALPTADGTAGQSIITDGSGNLTFGTAAGTGITAVVQDTSPQLGGDLESNGNDILFADNDKAVFGAGSDFSIFHDGSSSVIRDSGTGNLAIQAEDFAVQSADASATHIFVDASSGYTALNYGGSTKLNTSSTGIDVTGTVTADGLTVDGAVDVNSSVDISGNLNMSGSGLIRTNDGTEALPGIRIGTDNDNGLYRPASNEIGFSTAGTQRMRIDSSGNLLGGPSGSPVVEVDVAGEDLKVTGAVPGLELVESDNGGSRVRYAVNNSGLFQSLYGADTSTFGSTTVQTRRSDGDENQVIYTYDGGANDYHWWGTRGGGDRLVQIDSNGKFRVRGGDVSFFDDGVSSEAFFWDASESRLGLGTTSPATAVEIESNANGQTTADIPTVRLTNSDTTTVATDIAGSFEFYAKDASSPNYVSGFVRNVSEDAGVNYALTLGSKSGNSNATEHMRIDSAGNVGIGTSSPNLQFFNNLVVGNDASGDKGITIRSNAANRGVLAFSDTDSATDGRYTGFISYDHSDNAMKFHTNGGNERMRIDSSGNVILNNGAGTLGTFSSDLTIGKAGAGLRFEDGTVSIRPHNISTNVGSDNAVDLGWPDTRFKNLYLSNAAYLDKVIGHDDTNTYISFIGADVTQFVQGGAESMRLDASGNLLVGKDSTNFGFEGAVINNNGSAEITKNGGSTLFLNRKTSDGDIASFYKDGSAVGSIGCNNNDPYIARAGGNGFRWYSGAVVPTNDSGATADNAMDLGSSIGRFDDIYATNSTIQTSDRNEKQDIEELSDAEQRVAVACKGLLRKYRWKSSVEEKGDDARIHFGIIAQDLQDAFTAEGLDAGRYGMFINSTWTDEETGEERSRMGVRYSELLAFIISAI